MQLFLTEQRAPGPGGARRGWTGAWSAQGRPLCWGEGVMVAQTRAGAGAADVDWGQVGEAGAPLIANSDAHRLRCGLTMFVVIW